MILVYDVTNRNSFANIERLWLEQVELYCNRGADHCVLMLLANKTDLVTEGAARGARAVGVEEGMELAQRKGMIFGECSSKSNTGLQEAITALADRLLSVYDDQSHRPSNGIKLENYDHTDGASDEYGCGC